MSIQPRLDADLAAGAPRFPPLSRAKLLELRLNAIEQAHDHLIPYARLVKPWPGAEDDPRRSLYLPERHHHFIAEKLEQVANRVLPRIIVTAPPRSGKTELASKLFPAWFAGKFPSESVILATYNEVFSRDFGRAVKDYMRSPAHRQVFPDFGLKTGRASASRLENLAGGVAFFTGVGGSLTGRGGHCFPAGTMISTCLVPKPIEAIRPGEQVLSYDQAKGRFVCARVEAISHRQATGLLRITTTAGRVVEATPDHPFLVEGQWIEARELAIGDLLLRAVRADGSENRVRYAQASQARLQPSVLLEPVRGAWAQCSAVWRTLVLALRQASAQGNKLWQQEIRQNLVLANVQGGTAGKRDRGSRTGTNETLRVLQCDVRATSLKAPLLLDGLQQPLASRSHARRSESEMEGRCLGKAGRSAQPENLSGGSATRTQTRRQQMRDVPVGRGHPGSPYRRGSDAQPAHQSGDAVQELPHPGAFFTGQSDPIVSIERVHGSADVYDLQVAETHTFVAGQIVVHNCLIGDDLIKSKEQADSAAERQKAWDWYNSVFRTRLMDQDSSMLILATRWHEDDIIGRITDPDNPFYQADEAAMWTVINLPAIAVAEDPLGREIGQVLWPARFGPEFLESQQRSDPRMFAALYQGTPAAVEGNFIRSEWIHIYRSPRELPDRLRRYMSMDLAVTKEEQWDRSCILPIGIDHKNDIWILPEAWWQRAEADKLVEAIVKMIKKHEPLILWGEKGVLAKSIGPFLRKRMLEESAFTLIEETAPRGDKQARAMSIIGRMSQKKVHFPAFAPWWPAALNEMMKFPAGNRDDFVDALSILGQGLQRLVSAPMKVSTTQYKEGTFGYMKEQEKRATRMFSMSKGSQGW